MSDCIKNKKTNLRNPAMDIIRTVAFLTVIAVHFFLNCGYYKQPVEGTRMYIMTLVRTFLMICVPLFMVLSGYLMRKKTVDKAYFLKIFKTLIIYFLASVFCVFVKIILFDMKLDTINILEGFFEFTNAPYAWYVEMYIGLFLIAPFLNLAYNGLESKRKKQLLIIVMIFLTAGPSLFNIFKPDINWFLNPTSSKDYFQLVPDWWVGIYPISYYFIGCYLNEYGLKIKTYYNVLAIIFVFFASGTFSFYRSYGVSLTKGIWENHNSIAQVIQTVLVFTLFANLKYEKFPLFLVKFFRLISDLSLGGYLVSWVFDNMFYSKLNGAIEEIPKRFDWFFVAVAVIFCCSLIVSYIINSVYNISVCIFQKKQPKKLKK